MQHLSDELLHRLAKKINADGEYTDTETAQMQHIAGCDACYHMLCSLMALEDITTNAAAYAKNVSEDVLRMTFGETVAAVLHLAVRAVNSVLDQLDPGAGDWMFRKAPLAFGGARSPGKASASGVKKLTDADNSQTCVTYDPGKKLLVIQIDSRNCSNDPVVSIACEDGTAVEVHFEKVEHLYYAEVHDLPDGEYKITLEK